MTILSTHVLVARYGDFQSLNGVDIDVAEGEAVALIGANGAGKSSFLRSVMGLLAVKPEMVRLEGQPAGRAEGGGMRAAVAKAAGRLGKDGRWFQSLLELAAQR